MDDILSSPPLWAGLAAGIRIVRGRSGGLEEIQLVEVRGMELKRRDQWLLLLVELTLVGSGENLG